jgi:hypothetical protein
MKKKGKPSSKPVHPIHDTPRALILGGKAHPIVEKDDER